MLTGPGAGPHETLRICSICDGIDAVLRLAGYIAQFPAQAQRTDLTLSEALDRLRGSHGERFDQIVIAPDAGKEAAPRLIEAVVAEARQHTPRVIVLLPLKARLEFAASPEVTVLYGPPFTPLATVPAGPVQPVEPPAAGEAVSPRGRGGLWTRLRPAARTAGKEAADPPPRGRAARDLPDQIGTLAVQPLCGGAGGTTLSVNLAVEIARSGPPRPEVLLIDLNLQFGNVATYLNLPANSRIVDAYRSLDKLDTDAFELCLQPAGKHLRVFAGPGEILPVDGLTSDSLRRIVALARDQADLVILDLPHLIADWAEVAYREADAILAPGLLDVRSAQNAARLRELLRSESFAATAMLPLLNRAPRKPSQAWRAARAEFEKSWQAPFFALLPEGGEEVASAGDAGLPLSDRAPQNPLRQAIRDMAARIAGKVRPRAAAAAGV